MDRYSFPVRLLHSQLSAGSARRTDFIHSKPKKGPQKALFLRWPHFFAGGSKELTGANVKGEQQAFNRLNHSSTMFMGLPKHFSLRQYASGKWIKSS
jgi:hypothetical protein